MVYAASNNSDLPTVAKRETLVFPVEAENLLKMAQCDQKHHQRQHLMSLLEMLNLSRYYRSGKSKCILFKYKNPTSQ